MASSFVLLCCMLACVVRLSDAVANLTLMVPMRDGVTLLTHVDFPQDFVDGDQRPIVLDRSPYGPDYLEPMADNYLSLGHIAVRQDVRGTGNASGGYFELWHDCLNDGYDTIQYLISQPYSSGVVYECGTSADGIDSLSQMPAPHPALAGQFAQYSGLQGWEMLYQGGALKLGLMYTWIKNNVARNASATFEVVALNEGPGPWWDMLNASTPAFVSRVTHPVIVSSGWYDLFTRGAVDAFSALQAWSDPSVRSQHVLVVDPVGHCSSARARFPVHTISGSAALPTLLSLDLFVNGSWATSRALGAPSLPEGVDVITLYVMGALAAWEPNAPGNYWTTLPTWPVYTQVPFYLDANEHLAWYTEPPPATSTESYLYDPIYPVPTYGGSNFYLPCGPLDQDAIGPREDVLNFISDELTGPVAITGPVTVQLFVSSNATDTDFTAKLMDIYPNGSAVIINDGIMRMRWRDGAAQPVPQMMTPGQVYVINITLWDTSLIFNTGHRIGLAVSSSNYPRFSAATNTGANLVPFDNITVPAVNSVYYGGEALSALWLPVVQMSQLPPYDVFNAVYFKGRELHHVLTAFEARRGVAVNSTEPPPPAEAAGVEERLAYVQRWDALALASQPAVV